MEWIFILCRGIVNYNKGIVNNTCKDESENKNMKVSDNSTQQKMAHYVEQLNKLGYKDTAGLDYSQLKQKLAIARMKHVDYSSPENVWFE